MNLKVTCLVLGCAIGSAMSTRADVAAVKERFNYAPGNANFSCPELSYDVPSTAVVLGALGGYWLTMMHYYNMRLHWYGVIPWMTNPEHAGQAWAGSYNILVYVGAVIGLALLWTSARALNLGLEFLARQTFFPALPKPPLPPGALPTAVSLAASFAVLLAVTAWTGRREPALPEDISAVMEA